MSTNAVIRIESYKTAELYKHWDGYPEGVIEWLRNFNEDFIKHRGNDNPYKFAQLIRSSAFDAEKYNLDDDRHTGWGVYPRGQAYYDFIYILKKDGSVEVRTAKEKIEDDF